MKKYIVLVVAFVICCSLVSWTVRSDTTKLKKNQAATVIASQNAISESVKQLIKLRQAVDKDLKGSFDAKLGAYSLVYGRIPAANVETFIEEHKSLFGISSFKDEFKLLNEVSASGNGPVYKTYQQHFGQIPVYGARMTVAVDQKNNIRSISLGEGEADLRGLALKSSPSLTVSQAEDVIESKHQKIIGIKRVGLYVYKKRLAYIFDVVAEIGRNGGFRYFIDADTGAVIDKISKVRFADCVPTEVEWLDDLENNRKKMVPVCKESNGTNQLTSETPDYHVEISSRYVPEDSQSLGDLIGILPDVWTHLNDTIQSHNLVRPYAHMNMVLKVWAGKYAQPSWGFDADGSFADITIYNGDYCSWAAMWLGLGHIQFCQAPAASQLHATSLATASHELSHGLFDTYQSEYQESYSGNNDYWDVNKRESSCLEEGLADSFGRVTAAFYNYAYQGLDMDSSYYDQVRLHAADIKDRQDYLKILDEAGQVFHQCYVFGGYISKQMYSALTGGITNDSGKYLYAIDVQHLFTNEELGWLFFETLRHKEFPNKDIKTLANALMATCMERTDGFGKIFDAEQCKNLERYFILTGVHPELGYQSELLSKYQLFVIANAVIKNPRLSYVKEKRSQAVTQMTFDAGNSGFLVIPIDEESKLKSVPAKLCVDVKESEANLYSTCKSLNVSSVDSFSEWPVTWCYYSDIQNVLSGDCAKEMTSPLVDNVRHYEIYAGFADNVDVDSLQKESASSSDMPAPETIETIENVGSDDVQSSDDRGGGSQQQKESGYYNATSIVPIDIKPNDNVYLLDVGVNFAPTISVAKENRGSASILTGAFEVIKKIFHRNAIEDWIVTVGASNVGNKPAYPVVEVAHGEGGSIVSDYLAAIASSRAPSDLSVWQQTVDLWKTGSFNSVPMPAPSSGLIEQCSPKYPHLVRPGESFCVAKIKVKARSKDTYHVVLDPQNKVDELNENDNAISFIIGDVAGNTVGGVASKTIENVNKASRAGDVSQIELLEVPDNAAINKVPLEPYFSQGELIVAPPDVNGNYSQSSSINPFVKE